jgi:type IV pilus assembly protein PilV
MPLISRQVQNGFTLLEVMIAVLILGIGLLGLAHLQITSLKHNQSAEFRTQASVLASDMLDRMRANQSAAQNGNYAIALNANPPNNTDTVADADIAAWLQQIVVVLPQGDGAINCNAFDPAEAFVCDVTVSWTEVQEDDNLGTTSFSFSGSL